MLRKVVLLVFFSIVSDLAFCQMKDTVGIIISKAVSDGNNNSVYAVEIKNYTEIPICILFSSFLNLINDIPQSIGVVNKGKSFGLYSLQVAMKDSINDYENANDNYNGEIILPQQEIKFKISISLAGNEKKLQVQYLLLPDFCYKSFEKEIFNNATNWYSWYRKISREINFPK